jgi:hypothetical protein
MLTTEGITAFTTGANEPIAEADEEAVEAITGAGETLTGTAPAGPPSGFWAGPVCAQAAAVAKAMTIAQAKNENLDISFVLLKACPHTVLVGHRSGENQPWLLVIEFELARASDLFGQWGGGSEARRGRRLTEIPSSAAS